MTSGYRYLIPEQIFDELTEKVKQSGDKIFVGWLFAERKDYFGIVTDYIISEDETEAHEKPKSWMRMKKNKIYNMRKFKQERGCDIVWSMHSHPDGNEELHEVDEEILNYLSTGVMIIVTQNNVIGHFYDKRESKKAIRDKMLFEIISE